MFLEVNLQTSQVHAHLIPDPVGKYACSVSSNTGRPSLVWPLKLYQIVCLYLPLFRFFFFYAWVGRTREEEGENKGEDEGEGRGELSSYGNRIENWLLLFVDHLLLLSGFMGKHNSFPPKAH